MFPRSGWLLAVATVTLGCTVWTEQITRRAGPEPDGPCIEIVNPESRVWKLYKGTQLISTSRFGPSFDEVTAALADDPESTALLERKQQLAQIKFAGAGVFGATAAAFAISNELHRGTEAIDLGSAI